MRRAMAEAEVGDDVFGDDPTVKELERRTAELLAKEAAVFVPSGTMANQIALRLLGRPGTAVVAGRHQHVVAYELGAAAVNAPIQFHTIADDDGPLDPAEVAELIEAAHHHRIEVSAVFVENTHMHSGGKVWPLDRLAAVASAGVPVHLDGARLFNAEVASGVPAAAFAAHATTVMCCLSKGLGAPVGSLLAADAAVVAEARAHRKRLGGAMRQAGVLAAPGLIALRENVERLADDHARARRLAEAVAERWPGSLEPEAVETNLVVFPHPDAGKLLAHHEGEGVLGGTLGPALIRLVTHLDVDDAGIDQARRAIAAAPV
jgi:threonine aldolase